MRQFLVRSSCTGTTIQAGAPVGSPSLRAYLVRFQVIPKNKTSTVAAETSDWLSRVSDNSQNSSFIKHCASCSHMKRYPLRLNFSIVSQCSTNLQHAHIPIGGRRSSNLLKALASVLPPSNCQALDTLRNRHTEPGPSAPALRLRDNCGEL